jgi:UDP:flavonoid glycosyltransferase YjiC (YdhE family)
MKHLLAIDLGTYCDNALMENALYDLSLEHKIVYLTDKKHTLPFQYIPERFTTPTFFINDPKLKVANSHKNILEWSLKHPVKAYQALQWSRIMHDKLISILQKYKIQAILILYPATSLLWQIPDDVLKSIPTFVIYYAPGFLNTKIPWLFDSTMKRKTFHLYHSNKHDNLDSGWKYLKRISMLIKNKEDIIAKLQLTHHIYAWDNKVTPVIKFAISNIKSHYIGALINHHPVKQLLPTIPSSKHYIFMSFGSYGQTEELQKRLQSLVKPLTQYCQETESHVIYHNGTLTTPCITSINGFIPYEEIVPKSHLVIFTGSACLQNLCFYHQVPMFFVPLLAEQYFWAKNYYYHTGTNPTDIKLAATSLKVKKYLAIVSNHMRTENASLSLQKLVNASLPQE